MFTTKWSTSERKFDVIVERDVKVPMPDGTMLDGDIYRPSSNEKFPVILGAHAYNKHLQSPPMRPVGFTPMRGYVGSDPDKGKAKATDEPASAGVKNFSIVERNGCVSKFSSSSVITLQRLNWANAESKYRFVRNSLNS
jgi:hypothetical protein